MNNSVVKNAKRWKKVGKWTLFLSVAGGLFLWGTNHAVLSSAKGKIFSDVSAMPGEDVALVLGTSPKVKSGNKNLYFEHRMDAAAALYQAKKVKKILVSGDNGKAYYDEPTAMMKALVSRGIPEKDIVRDYAGFHTLDSIVRAHRVFGVKRCTIVTDDFHLPRALYIAEHEGLECVGFQTKPLPKTYSSGPREIASRALMWIDLHILNKQPKFLGPKESI